MSRASRPLRGCAICFAMTLASALVLAGCQTVSARPSRDNLVLYGGFGFLAQDNQSALVDLLVEDAQRLPLQAETLISRMNDDGGLRRISPYPVALSEMDAVAALRDTAEELPRDPIEALRTVFSGVYGLFLVGALEQHVPAAYPVSSQQPTDLSYHDYFLTSVSALLFDFSTDRIVVTTSARGIHHIAAADAPLTGEADRLDAFRQAYAGAADKALQRLAAIVERRGRRLLKERPEFHMVTGMFIKQDAARRIFGWQPRAFQDYCAIPSGCPAGADACNALNDVLIHGVTEALSASGHPVLPPLGVAQWRYNNAHEITGRFVISQNRGSLVERQLLFDLDPEQAAVKYLAVLKGVARSREEVGETLYRDTFAAQLEAHRADTGVGSCSTGSARDIGSRDFTGLFQANRSKAQDELDPSRTATYFTLGTMDALARLEGRL